MPTPHVKEWVKTTPYGDYKDPKQNHKEHVRDTEQYNLVHCMMNAYPNRKHCGSKSLKTLRQLR